MSMSRIFTLFRKEIRSSATNFLVIFAVVIPIILSLLVNLVFNDLFSDEPRIGLIDPGNSAFAVYLVEQPQLSVSRYADIETMKKDIEPGKVETGLVLPENFDDILRSGEAYTMKVYLWGETPYKHRLVTDTAMANAAADIAMLEQPVKVEVIQLGDSNVKNLADQFLPLLVLMTIILGGVMVPAVSLIEEKQKRTLIALFTSPVRLWEIYCAKAMLGIAVGIGTSVITLFINRAFNSFPLLLLVLFLGAMTSSLLGIVLGSMLKDLNVLLAVLKSGGILLIAPAIVDFVPQAPEWIARIFPTFYMLNPVLEVAIRSAGFLDIFGNLAILLVFSIFLLAAIWLSISRNEGSQALI